MTEGPTEDEQQAMLDALEAGLADVEAEFPREAMEAFAYGFIENERRYVVAFEEEHPELFKGLVLHAALDMHISGLATAISLGIVTVQQVMQALANQIAANLVQDMQGEEEGL